MTTTASRRLAGVRFETAAPPQVDSLPRMDIPVFVGFAASGPLNTPVVVEDSIQFHATFGDDVRLAHDVKRNQPIYDYLAPTVRAFFNNGGRRCWIIRVEHDNHVFGADLFVDTRLATTGVRHLLTEAQFIRDNSLDPTLKGIHAALAIEEATLIAIPDAIQRSWQPVIRLIVTIQAGDSVQAVKPIEHGDFQQCGSQRLDNIDLRGVFNEANDEIELTWSRVDADAVIDYTLEAENSAHSETFQAIWSGSHLRYSFKPVVGSYRYRIHAESDELAARSNIVMIEIRETQELVVADTNDSTTLLEIQHALIVMCAARGDMLAILTLPEHWYTSDALAYRARFQSLEADDVPLLSYAAMYHPWVLVHDQQQVIPPDGVVCGLLATRAIERGTWIAPANQPLRDVVWLTPAIDRSDWQAFQDAHINLIQQDVRGFMTLNADTLSSNPDVRSINVRRLLILLRRLALKLGATYVFEPNTDTFRRLVQRGFEAMLEDLFLRGAFAGATAASAFQVTIDSSLNTKQRLDQGMFMVEIKVAPSLPMTFLIIRLIQTSERGLIVQER